DDDQHVVQHCRHARRPIFVVGERRGREDQPQQADHQREPARRQLKPDVARKFRVHALCPTCAKYAPSSALDDSPKLARSKPALTRSRTSLARAAWLRVKTITAWFWSASLTSAPWAIRNSLRSERGAASSTR